MVKARIFEWLFSVTLASLQAFLGPSNPFGTTSAPQTTYRYVLTAHMHSYCMMNNDSTMPMNMHMLGPPLSFPQERPRSALQKVTLTCHT